MPNLPVKREATGLPKRIRHADFIERADLWAARNLQKNLRKLKQLAEGVLHQKGTPKEDPCEFCGLGKEDIYRTLPDRAALIYLVNRGLGTPPQRYEITGDEGGPLEIVPWMPSEEVVDGEVTDIDALEEK